MVDSIPDAVRLLAAGTLLFVALSVPAAPIVRPSADAPIDLEAASSDFDYKNNTLLFRRVKITQGQIQVEAQEARATGLNFENSDWTLTGDVRITVPDGRLESSDAKVSFRNNEIVRAVIRGAPARFEQRLEQGGQLAQGHAASIEYDVQGGSVRLAGDAWLSDGQNAISGRTLVYDIARERVAANPDETDPGGVRITINPKSQQKQSPPQQDKSP